jgi:hypothetical protein
VELDSILLNKFACTKDGELDMNGGDNLLREITFWHELQNVTNEKKSYSISLLMGKYFLLNASGSLSSFPGHRWI